MGCRIEKYKRTQEIRNRMEGRMEITVENKKEKRQ